MRLAEYQRRPKNRAKWTPWLGDLDVARAPRPRKAAWCSKSVPTNRQIDCEFRDHTNSSGRGRPLHIGKHSTSASERKGQSCFHIGLPLCRRRPTLRDLLAENVVQTKCLQTIENK